jgi:hypothetical protein
VAGIVTDVGAVAGEGEDGGSGGSGGEGSVVEGGGGGGEADKGVREDAVGPVDGGVARQDRGERRSSPSTSKSPDCSTSLRRLLVLFAGGVVTSGGEGGASGIGVVASGVGVGASGVGVGASGVGVGASGVGVGASGVG